MLPKDFASSLSRCNKTEQHLELAKCVKVFTEVFNSMSFIARQSMLENLCFRSLECASEGILAGIEPDISTTLFEDLS